ncbi:hypothetical protein ACK3SF_00145 [Candidatus Nanosalina sp. VS9-1]|uniref:hypothetical protein n=1 Tax=Candidatus Nanosalina sp. VS9-1 TaxID=3388566 RepID=UPI0039DF8927
MSFDGPSGNPRIIDMDEEMPDYDTILKAQNTYEELLEELERYSMAKIQGGDVQEELELVRDDIRDTRAYIKVEIETVQPQDFIVGDDAGEYDEKAERLFRPKVDFLEERFESAEEYREHLLDRL